MLTLTVSIAYDAKLNPVSRSRLLEQTLSVFLLFKGETEEDLFSKSDFSVGMLEIWPPIVPSLTSTRSCFSGFLIGWDEVTCPTSGWICEWKRGRLGFSPSSRTDHLHKFAMEGWVLAISTQIRIHKYEICMLCGYNRCNRKRESVGNWIQRGKKNFIN